MSSTTVRSAALYFRKRSRACAALDPVAGLRAAPDRRSLFFRSLFSRKTGGTLALVLLGLGMLAGNACATPILVGADMNEQVVMVPAVSGTESVLLETTIFKPPGPGPFPVLLMNHGKSLGNPRTQKRDRFIAVSREFVKRGYAVVIPMRKGFAQSTGDYREKPCDMAGNAQMQADDLQNALNYIVGQDWADKDRLLVGGQSYGGLAAMAFGTRGFPGVRALINFAGGLRIYGSLCRWNDSLVQAFAEFGKDTMVPSLWFYGENDRHFKPELAARMHAAYVQAGGKAKLVAYGPFKHDAHGMSSSWDGVRIWWPETEKLLKEVGLPTDEAVVIADDPRTQKTDYAIIDNVDAVPYLKDKGREAYRTFLGKSLPRAFALSPSGAWSWAEDGDDPAAQALVNCQKSSAAPCKLYAVNDKVVWPDNRPQPAQRLAIVPAPANSTASAEDLVK